MPLDENINFYEIHSLVLMSLKNEALINEIND